MKTIFLVLISISLFSFSDLKFAVPDVVIQALKPKGIIVTIPDSPGVQYFAFHGNVNFPIKGKEEGSISKDATRASNGLWLIKDENVELRVGDVIYYWVFVQHNRLGFDKQEQKFTVAALINEGTTPDVSTGPIETCTPSITTINGGKSACSGSIIFEDQFNNIDETKWQKQYYIADKPDHEFVTYEPQNIFIADENLNLRASVRDNVENINVLEFSNGCTGTTCSKRILGNLLPPIVAGQVKSKFSFRYGKIFIRAKLPAGDWIFPQLHLEPKDYSYGSDYKSGRIWLAFARGNADLKDKSGKQIGNSVLYSGPVLSRKEPQRSSSAKVFNLQGGKSWSDSFHTFTITWKPDSMTVDVDGDQQQINSLSAPFDKEFIITLGIGAGGHSDFPDDCKSSGVPKPWKLSSVQDTRVFYEDRSNWLPTWKVSSTSVLQIDYIKIWSL